MQLRLKAMQDILVHASNRLNQIGHLTMIGLNS